MIKGIKFKLILKLIIAGGIAFISCSDQVSGFGAETTNGMVTVNLSNDTNYDSCLVQIISRDLNPLLIDTTFEEYSGYAPANGELSFPDVKAGLYNIYVKNYVTGKKSLLTDIEINGDTSITSKMSYPGDIKVSFKNSESVLDTVNGCLFILGYPEFVKLSSKILKENGTYSAILDSIPPSLIKTLSYTSVNDGSSIQNLSDSVPVFSNDTTVVEAVLYYSFINSFNSKFIPDSVTSFKYGKNGINWTTDGTRLLKIDTDSVYVFTSQDLKLPEGKIKTIFEADCGAIWIGSENGVSMTYDLVNWNSYTHLSSGMPLLNVTSIMENSDGLMFVGTGGYGLFSFDGNNWENFTHYGNALPSDSITTLLIDSNGDLWGGTLNGIFTLKDNIVYIYSESYDFFKSLHITALSLDSNDCIWLGTQAGEIFHLTDSLWYSYSMATNPLINSAISSIVCDEKGDIWAGSMEGRFYRYPNNGDINGWLVYLGSSGVLPGVSITSIDISDTGVICCGTLGSGLFVLGTSSFDVTANWKHCY